jgi:hypothetical protein
MVQNVNVMGRQIYIFHETFTSGLAISTFPYTIQTFRQIIKGRKMASQRLLSHLLSSRLSREHENIVSESLAFILNSSATAKDAFLRYINHRIARSLDATVFINQEHNPDLTVPDISGYDSDNIREIIIEAKFWATLTDNQSTEYLKLLPDNRDSLLMFLVPDKRKLLLRKELHHRCKQAEVNISEFEEDQGSWLAVIDGCKYLLVTSWGIVIRTISDELRLKGETDTLSDIVQIENFCNFVDSEGFMPLLPSDLDSVRGTRHMQFVEIINETGHVLSERGIWGDWLRNDATTPRSFGRYGALFPKNETREPVYLKLDFNAEYWSQYAATPFWFIIQEGDKFPQKAKKELAAFGQQHQIETFKTNNGFVLPVYIPSGEEKSRVIEAIVSFAKKLKEVLVTVYAD